MYVKTQRVYVKTYSIWQRFPFLFLSGFNAPGPSATALAIIKHTVLNWEPLRRRILKCYELLDKITTSLATFETLISLSIDDDSVIDAKEFHKLQTLYLQLMTHVRNVDRKMKVQTEENFQKTIMDELVNLKKALERR